MKKGVYDFELDKEWFKKTAPYLKLVTGTLSLVLPVASSALQVANDAATKALQDQIGLGKEAIDAIEAGIQNLLLVNDKILSMGGDYSVTYPIVKAITKKHGKLNILHLDGHPDLYDNFEGIRFSHACPFARIMEEGLASRLVQVGIRTMNTHQRNQANRFGAEVYEMKKWEAYKKVSVRR